MIIFHVLTSNPTAPWIPKLCIVRPVTLLTQRLEPRRDLAHGFQRLADCQVRLRQVDSTSDAGFIIIHRPSQTQL